ncbi:hypothetical protein ACP6C7_04035 [Mycolicibacterium septicum]|uniref:Uncharacterized protein n=1 Tax=Mycolicibacterium septicum TaxID=98668 RepID=A0ABW9LNU3_9MYCO
MNKFRSFMTSHTTLVAALALALGVLLTLAFTPGHDEGVAPPAAVSYRANGDGACQVTVLGYDGRLWMADQGSDALRRVDGVGDACTPAAVTDRVTVGDRCVRVLNVDGRLYLLPDRDGDGPLEPAPAEAARAVTGCRTDPDPNR